jgi:xanthine/uracil permease
VTGIVITLIGISLIKVGITDLGGGFNAPTSVRRATWRWACSCC